MDICGIYALRFANTESVYIGQSLHIYQRYKEHLRKLNANTGVAKLQYAFEKYGTPTLDILLECLPIELDAQETLAIEIFDSVINGFNTMGRAEDLPRPDNSGERHGNSLYSNSEIIAAFKMLLTESDLAKVSYNTGISYSSVANISSGAGHTWLSKEFPEEYALLMTKKHTRNNGREINTIASKRLSIPILISPEGIEYAVTNISKFAKEHGIAKSCFNRLILKQSKKSHGWTLKDDYAKITKI